MSKTKDKIIVEFSNNESEEYPIEWHKSGLVDGGHNWFVGDLLKGNIRHNGKTNIKHMWLWWCKKCNSVESSGSRGAAPKIKSCAEIIMEKALK
jgi:hypothetical protein